MIRGPRQIGKSCWLKHFLASNKNQKGNLLFFSCEDIDDYKSLSEILKANKDRRIFN